MSSVFSEKMVTGLRLSTGAAPARGCVARAASSSQASWQQRAAAVGVASVLSLGAVSDAAVANEFSVRTLQCCRLLKMHPTNLAQASFESVDYSAFLGRQPALPFV